MSHYEYEVAKTISGRRYPFAALLMASFSQAKPADYDALAKAFPLLEAEFKGRENVPGGILAHERKSRLEGKS